jgi:hypothetical protein
MKISISSHRKCGKFLFKILLDMLERKFLLSLRIIKFSQSQYRGFCVYRKRLQKQKYLALLLYAHEKITEDFVQV